MTRFNCGSGCLFNSNWAHHFPPIFQSRAPESRQHSQGLSHCCSWQAKELGAISPKQSQNNAVGVTTPLPATAAGPWPKPGQKRKESQTLKLYPFGPFKCKSVRKSSNDFDWFSGLGFCFCLRSVPRRQVLDKGPAVFGHF